MAIVDDLKYNIFNPRTCPKENFGPLNMSYHFWKDFWHKIYKDNHSLNDFTHDDFFRQDFVCSISQHNSIVAMHLYTIFNLSLDCVTDHSYFHFYSPQFIEQVKKRGGHKVMSMEFFTVNPQFRSSKTGLSFGRVMLSLGLKLFSELDVDAAIGPARTDVNAHKMAYEVGFECIEKETLQRGFPCDLVACFQGQQRESHSADVNEVVNRLWVDFKLNKKLSFVAA